MRSADYFPETEIGLANMAEENAARIGHAVESRQTPW